MSGEFLAKATSFFFENQETISKLKDDQYVKDAISRAADLMKVASAVWAKPETQQLYEAAKKKFDLGAPDKPVVEIKTDQQRSYDGNILNAKGDR